MYGMVESLGSEVREERQSLHVVCYRAQNETWGLKIEGRNEFEMPL